jgi:nicotinate-nucleotide adenylyltransferase
MAHLHAGETALYQAGLDRVLFMPAGEPWQKSDRQLTGAAHRLEMIRLAIADIDGFEVDDREIGREGPTYTIDTLHSFPESEELSLILGTDAALGIQSWHRWEEVVDRVSLLVVPRPGTDARDVQAVAPDAVFLDMAVLEISSTEIREMAALGEPFRFLVPLAVHDYIESLGLYAEPEGDDMVVDSLDQEEGS